MKKILTAGALLLTAGAVCAVAIKSRKKKKADK